MTRIEHVFDGAAVVSLTRSLVRTASSGSGLEDAARIDAIRALEELVCVTTATQAALAVELDESCFSAPTGRPRLGTMVNESGPAGPRGRRHKQVNARPSGPPGMTWWTRIPAVPPRHIGAKIVATEMPVPWLTAR